MIEVYKFGGASVKDAESIRRVLNIVRECKSPLVVVVSAIGKSTNALEDIHQSYIRNRPTREAVQHLLQKHQNIIDELLGQKESAFIKLYKWYTDLFQIELAKPPSGNGDKDYDRIVSFGELFSTSIISAYFHEQKMNHQWLDARKLIRTSDDWREGKVEWSFTKELIGHNVKPSGCPLYLTQGFIASNQQEQVVTLGREGSDYSAAIFANALQASKMTIWKDVPGVMSADPRWYEKAELIPEMTYKEAVEMSYFGASVIHPKTLKPLENVRIPLWVRSFKEPELIGTVIHKVEQKHTPVPVIIKKQNQAIITIMPKDFSFMQEENLSLIFKTFEEFRIKVNIMEKAALSFTACVNYNESYFDRMVDALMDSFIVKYNTGLELCTIRHHSPALIEQFIGKNETFMEQQNRDTAWFVIRH